MNKTLLKEEVMSFPPAFLKRWRNGDYSLLTSANIPSCIKQIIVKKAKMRPGRRFFGEAFVAGSMSKEMIRRQGVFTFDMQRYLVKNDDLTLTSFLFKSDKS